LLEIPKIPTDKFVNIGEIKLRIDEIEFDDAIFYTGGKPTSKKFIKPESIR